MVTCIGQLYVVLTNCICLLPSYRSWCLKWVLCIFKKLRYLPNFSLLRLKLVWFRKVKVIFHFFRITKLFNTMILSNRCVIDQLDVLGLMIELLRKINIHQHFRINQLFYYSLITCCKNYACQYTVFNQHCKRNAYVI